MNWTELNFFNSQNFTDIIEDLNRLQSKDIPFYPCLDDVFNAFQYFDINQTKVVILRARPLSNTRSCNAVCRSL